MKNLSCQYDYEPISRIAREIALEAFSRLPHNDPRLARRLIKSATRLFQSPGKPFSKAFSQKAERQAAYRLIENDSLAPDQIVRSIQGSLVNRVSNEKPATIFVVQDSSTISKSRFEKVEGLGPIGKASSRGFFYHAALALDISGTPIGLAAIDFWKRDQPTAGSREKWKHLPIEEKESYRWLKTMKDVATLIPRPTRLIFLSDRESDIHEYFETATELDVDFVVRHSHNRRVEGEGKYVREELADSPILGHYELEVPQVNRRQKRKIQVSVQAVELTFKLQAGGLKIHRNRQPVRLWGLRVLEVSSNHQEKPMEWILYTSLPVETVEDAIECVRMYTCRWRIEEFNMVLKTGMTIEQNHFREAENIQRLLTIAIPMAVKLLEILYRSRENPSQDVAEVFSSAEIKGIKVMAKRQGVRIPPRITMKWATERIAFHGGWMGRKGDGRPGVRTLWDGLRDLNLMAEMIEAMGYA